ncbi:unnamed protein product [Angiostrongylus costaricensis]|uniref:Lysosomal acid phosphatase n=1 Tax=Angiostrongylus costaricensis TaxID=334426 RepID=A0A0R3Q1S8_ANGCS|nr:unnamed protein product [Angiostrongylus costaricensis]
MDHRLGSPALRKTKTSKRKVGFEKKNNKLRNLPLRQGRRLHEFRGHIRQYATTAMLYHEYISLQVYIRSTDSDRALTSAQAFLSGFYPAKGSFEWERGNHWQPIPIHSTTPDEPDLLLKPTSADCKNLDKLVDEEDAKQAKYYGELYKDMFKLLGERTGIANFSYDNVNDIYNIKRELINKMTKKQPRWVFRRWSKYNNRSTMEIISELRRIRRITKFNSTAKAKMLGGYLLYNWLQNAEKVANGTMTDPETMLLYSAHHGTLLALMYAMGVANEQLIPYASSFIMEIYEDGKDFEVELLFRNTTTKPPHPLKIKGCRSPCTVQKLAETYRNMLLKSYDEQQAATHLNLSNLGLGTAKMSFNSSLSGIWKADYSF